MKSFAATMFALTLTTKLAAAQTIEAYNPVPEVPPTSLAVQADGKVLIVGSFASVGVDVRNGVARLDEDGSVDESFVDPGVNNEVKTIAVQPDGKLLIGGGFTSVGGQPRHAMARLEADGTLDGTFADPGFNSNVWAIAVQPDGRILAAGDFTQIGTHAQNYFVRLNADGSFDGSFADPELCCNVARAVALQADGRIIIGGAFSQVGGVTHFYLARFSTNGTFDPAFPDTTDNIVPGSIVVAPDSSIYIPAGGDIVYKLAVDGAPVAGFTSAQMDAPIDSIALQPNGRIVISGIFENAAGMPRHALARLNANGSLDTTFGDLHFSFNAGDENGYIYGVAAQPDGRLVVVGNFSLANGLSRQYMARVATGDDATSALVVTPNGAGVNATWYRLGDGPELAQAPVLMQSSDGVHFTPIGAMTRVANGWSASASLNVHGAPFYLQALGTVSEGTTNGSSGQTASELYSSDTIFDWGFE